MDKDTSATNFMVRDRLMEAVVNREHEPITPFVERVRDFVGALTDQFSYCCGQLGCILYRGRCGPPARYLPGL